MMKFVGKLCFLALSASLMLAQTNTDTPPGSVAIEDQIKLLRQVLAEQQQQITEQRQEIDRQHDQIVQQSGEIQTLQQRSVNKQDAVSRHAKCNQRIGRRDT